MKDRTLNEFIGEVFGTFVLILLGDGVVANVGLAPRLAGVAYNWNTITIGWSMAVLIAVFVSGGVAGAHLNPAVTFALAIKRDFPWKKVIPFIIAQMLGAFLGALAVYLIYRDGLIAAGMPNVWSTGPGSVFSKSFFQAEQATGGAPYSMLTACIAEIFGTIVLLLAVAASGDEKNMGLKNNFGPFIVALGVLAVGLSLGGPSGYSINPARDLGPRILGALVGSKGLFDGLYWLIPPVLMPMIGGPIGLVLYDLFIAKNLPKGD
jgi:glycerol uptake facilitator protein